MAMGSGVLRSGSVWAGRREMKEEGKKICPTPSKMRSKNEKKKENERREN